MLCIISDQIHKLVVGPMQPSLQLAKCKLRLPASACSHLLSLVRAASWSCAAA